ncbi:hypothetical protein K456DRAFT_1763092 [Colletotrichum gloeosporioides 23]|nr:hypothetical protein K456DRAFT_1763092 [Colletotrichum gloeosporioides 23]
MALSYVWTQHPDREGLRRTVQEAMRHTGIGHVWIDALCVKQDDTGDLAREIPKMGLYYGRAAARYRGLGKQLKISKWSQRVWTFQEAVLNEQTIAWNGWGFCSMEDLAVAQIVEALGGRARSVTRLVKKVWAANTEGGSSAEATTWNPFLRHTMSPKVKLADMPTLWNNNKERQCGREEDLVYGYMGLVSDLPESITVDYGLGFAGVYDRLMRGRSVNLTVMCSSPDAAS